MGSSAVGLLQLESEESSWRVGFPQGNSSEYGVCRDLLQRLGVQDETEPSCYIMT